MATKQNCFLLKDKINMQENGPAMGVPTPSLLAEYFTLMNTPVTIMSL
jgi:hypothetical protein